MHLMWLRLLSILRRYFCCCWCIVFCYFNHIFIFNTMKIPAAFKTVVITQVLKREMTQKLLDNYWVITVASIFGSCLNMLCLINSILPSLSCSLDLLKDSLQQWWVFSSARQRQNLCYTWWSKCVWWSSPFHSINWFSLTLMVIRDLYQNISLKVKLLDGISDIFYINQDVRQERIPSIYTGFYKVNDIN